MSEKTELLESLKNLPEKSGVYEMRNAEDETLYVGKAKNLKSRVRSYFLDSAQHSARIQKLVEKVHHIEWTETFSEVEALLLETNLIKQKNPKFNILMRDDKNFCYIKVSTQEDFPRVTLTRRVLKDGAKYFGPKTSSSSVRKTIDLLQDIFHFRSTPLEIKEISEPLDSARGPENVEVSKSGNQKIPCLNYHLGKCDAPCMGKISKAKYSQKISAALKFLKGDYKEILASVKDKMMDYAKDGKFELAAKTRDKMKAIESISEKQIISAPDEFSADIIGTSLKFGHVFFHLFSLREGKIINSETFSVRLPEKTDEDTLNNTQEQEAFFSFLRSHPERVADSPKVIICDQKFFPDSSTLSIWGDFFAEKFGHTIEISLPQKAKRKKLLELATENAESYAKRHSSQFIKEEDNSEKILEILQKKLGMNHVPKRLECYDISHFSGQKTVASMVVFEDGKPKNSDYRSFNITSLGKGGIDDFASLEEATLRRLKRLPEKIPTDWKVEKIKKRGDFEGMNPSSPAPLPKGEGGSCISLSLWERLGEGFCSEFFYDKKNTKNKKNSCIKKIESSFYGFYTEIKGEKKIKKNKKLEFSVLVRKNNLLKRGEVFLENIVFPLMSEGDHKGTPLQNFFLISVFEKLRCEEYTVYVSDPEISAFLESLGFSEMASPQPYPHGKGGNMKKFSGVFHSSKNDSFAKVPDIMLIDGGKGQLSSVAKSLILSSYCDEITLCSLAKREEEIFLFNSKTGEISETDIQKNSPEGHLLQYIRDEAHRFAITKNRKGREKETMKSVLDEIKGLGPKMKKLLKQKGGVPAIREMSDEELLELVPEKVLVQLREKL